MAGPFSDWVVRFLARRNGGTRRPEQRLQALWLGAILIPVSSPFTSNDGPANMAQIGLIIFGTFLQYKVHWILPCIGLGIASFALQSVTTISWVVPFLGCPFTAEDYQILLPRGLLRGPGWRRRHGHQLWEKPLRFQYRILHPPVRREGWLCLGLRDICNPVRCAVPPHHCTYDLGPAMARTTWKPALGLNVLTHQLSTGYRAEWCLGCP